MLDSTLDRHRGKVEFDRVQKAFNGMVANEHGAQRYDDNISDTDPPVGTGGCK
jgi:hypothetical protein